MSVACITNISLSEIAAALESGRTSVNFTCPCNKDNILQPYPLYERPLAALDTLLYDKPLHVSALMPGDLLQVDFVVRTEAVDRDGVLVAVRVARLILENGASVL